MNVFYYVVSDIDYCNLRLVSKRWDKIAMSKVCLKSFLESECGLDERLYLKDDYKTLFYCSRRESSNNIVQCGFHKKLGPHKLRRNKESLLNLFVLALHNERPKTILKLYDFVKPFLTELSSEIINAFGLLLKYDSFIIQIVFQNNLSEFLSEHLFDFWFEYSSWSNYEKYVTYLSIQNILNCVKRPITIYTDNDYVNNVTAQRKVGLLLTILNNKLDKYQLEKLLFSLFFHRTSFSNTVVDFVLSFPLEDLINSKYLTPMVLVYKKFDFFKQHLDILEQPSLNFMIELVQSNLQLEFQHLVQLKKWSMNEQTALNILRILVLQRKDKSLILKWNQLFFNSINQEFKSEYNPFQEFIQYPIKIIKFWCKPQYVIDFILYHNISDHYSDFEFLKFAKPFVKQIQMTEGELRSQLIFKLFYSLGLKSKRQRCTRSIIKTFKIVKKWLHHSDSLLLKLHRILIRYMPFHYWSLGNNQPHQPHQPQLQAET